MIPFLFSFSRGLLFPLVALDKISKIQIYNNKEVLQIFLDL